MSNEKQITIRDGRDILTAVVDADRYHQLHQGFAACPQLNHPVGAMDANEALGFYTSQFAYHETKAYQVLGEALQYEKFVPILSTAGRLATSVEYDVEDETADTADSSGAGTPRATADVARATVSYKVYDGEGAYRYSVGELERAAQLGISIDARKATACINGFKRTMNRIALFGNTNKGITGIFNHASMAHASATTGGWGSATAEHIQIDINNAIGLIATATKENFIPNTLIISATAFNDLLRSRNEYTDADVLSYVLGSNASKARGTALSIYPAFGLETAGAGSTRRGLLYRADQECVEMQIPMQIEFLAPQADGLDIVINGRYRYAGPHFRRLASSRYIDAL